MAEQARLILKGDRLQLANELMQHTRISNLSELVGVMLTRYSKHMAATWEIEPTRFDDIPQAIAPIPAVTTGGPPIKTRPPGTDDDFI